MRVCHSELDICQFDSDLNDLVLLQHWYTVVLPAQMEMVRGFETHNRVREAVPPKHGQAGYIGHVGRIPSRGKFYQLSSSLKNSDSKRNLAVRSLGVYLPFLLVTSLYP